MQKTPSELTCSLSASLTQSTLSENSVWLFCSEATGNPSTVCPLRYLDNISTHRTLSTRLLVTYTPQMKRWEARDSSVFSSTAKRYISRRIKKITLLGHWMFTWQWEKASCFHCSQKKPSHKDLLQFEKHGMSTMPLSLPSCFFTSLSSSAKECQEKRLFER